MRSFHHIKYYILLTVMWVFIFFMLNPFSMRPVGQKFFGIWATSEVELKSGIRFEEVLSHDEEDDCIKYCVYFRDEEIADKTGLKIQVYADDEMVLDVDGAMLEWETVGARTILSIPFDHTKDAKSIRVVLENKGEDKPLFLLLHDKLATGESAVMIDGTARENSGLFSRLHIHKRQFSLINIVGWILLVVLSFAGLWFLGKPVEIVFLYASITAGIFWAVFNPFPHAYDEHTHFLKSASISDGHLINDVQHEILGVKLREDYLEIADLSYTPYNWSLNSEFYNSRMGWKDSFTLLPYAATYSPVPYFIPAAAMKIFAKLHAPFFMIILISRLSYLLCYIVLGFIGIRSICYYKTILASTLLLPMGLMLGASCTQDALIISSCICFIGVCLGLFFSRRQVRMRDMICLMICTVFIASPKYLIYTPLLALLILIRSEQYGKYKKIALISCIIGICLASLLIQVYLLKRFPYVEDRNGDVNVARQIKFVIGHLAYSIRNVFNYTVDSVVSHIQNNVYFIGSSIMFRSISFWVGSLTVVFALIAKDAYEWEDNRAKKKFVITISFICVVVYALVILALYAGYNPVGAWGIDGVQTRYLYPFLPLIFILLSQIPVTYQGKNYIVKFNYMIMAISFFSFGIGGLAC